MDWQTILALIAVLLASGYVSRRAYRTLSGGARGCGSGCNACPTMRGEPADGLVTLETRGPGAS